MGILMREIARALRRGDVELKYLSNCETIRTLGKNLGSDSICGKDQRWSPRFMRTLLSESPVPNLQSLCSQSVSLLRFLAWIQGLL